MSYWFRKVHIALLLILSYPYASVLVADPISSQSIIHTLMEGNTRYVHSTVVHHEDWCAKRLAQTQGQSPLAVVITCSDSRVPPEIIFDQALGDLFVIRMAGNVVDDFAMGSIEYGVAILEINTILVLGHSNCGAVDSALKGLHFDNHIQEIINAIHPAIASIPHDAPCSLERAIQANVRFVQEKLQYSQPVLAKKLAQGQLHIVGAYYDLSSGKVELLDHEA